MNQRPLKPLGFNLSACGLTTDQQWEFYRLFNMPFKDHPPALRALIVQVNERFGTSGLNLPGVIVAYLKNLTLDEWLKERGYVPINK